MSVLTKLFVVLVTILSVLLVAVMVPFVANTQNFREQLQLAEQAKQQAETAATNAQAQRQSANESAAKLVADHSVSRAELENRISRLTTDLAEARSEARSHANKNAQLLASVEGAMASAKQFATITEAREEELKTRRAQMLQQQTQIIQLSERSADLDSQLQTLNNRVRQFREQMTQLEERNAGLEQTIAALPDDVRASLAGGAQGDSAAPYMPPTPIRGQVVKVQQAADQVFVQVDVGTNDGVSENMKFWVHRKDGEFLGTLIITKADETESAGRMDIRQGEIAAGDKILTGSGF